LVADPIPIELSVKKASGATGAGAPHPVWGRGFRPFFLGTSVYGVIVVVVWMAMWRGWLPPPAWLAPQWWHGHEMLFGVVVAAIAGFLLTAAPVWTGRPALSGRPLAALAALWVLGRLAMIGAGLFPVALVAAIDCAFLPVVAIILARTVWGTGQHRNYGVVGLVGILALANAAVHAQALGLAAASAPMALRFTVDVVVVLVVVIGGRITPAFTANALLRSGVKAPVRSWLWLDRLAITTSALVALADLVAPRSLASGILATTAGLAVAARLAGWQTVRIWRDPLVWSLHAGMAWTAIGFLLVAAGDLGGSIPPTAGLHALTAGAMGAMIIAVVTRVSLGHTGRLLVLPKGAVGSYALVHAGALLRVGATLTSGPAAVLLLVLGAGLWAAAFVLFGVIYAPILVGPRADGKPG
jgi:uncharacterized protein involved in response to NO